MQSFEAIVCGGGIAGLWFAVVVAAGLRGRGRIRVYDNRWERAQDATIRWKAEHQRCGHRCDVATISSTDWVELPEDVQDIIFGPGAFAEQWPRTGSEGNDLHPRSLQVGYLEDALLRASQQANSCASVELLPMAYDEAEDQKVRERDEFNAMILADGEHALQLRDGLFGDQAGEKIPRSALPSPAETLLVSFDLDRQGASVACLSMAESLALSFAQSRYVLFWCDKRRGVLQMRLCKSEVQEVASLPVGEAVENEEGTFVVRSSDEVLAFTAEGIGSTWHRVLEGFRLYGIPQEAISSVTRLVADGDGMLGCHSKLRGRLSTSNHTPGIFVIGDSFRKRDVDFRHGAAASPSIRGAASLASIFAQQGGDEAMREGQALQSDILAAHAATMKSLRTYGLSFGNLEPEERLEMVLSEKPEHSEDDYELFSTNLDAALQKMMTMELPPPVASDLPEIETLRKHVMSASLSEETFRALARSSPWDVKSLLNNTGDDEGGGVIDLGGETPEGKARAAELEQRSNAGDAEAMFTLAIMLFTADGVDRDFRQSFVWMLRSAEAGFYPAYNCLGSHVLNGFGVPKDAQVAFEWFRKGAEAGDQEAQFNLGQMYFEGEGVEKNLRIAAKWWDKSAKQGLPVAQMKIADLLVADENPEELRRRGAGWMKKAALQGFPEANYKFALLLYNGHGVARNKMLACHHMSVAAEAGVADAQHWVGLMHITGDGVEADLEKGRFWVEKAAQQGHLEAISVYEKMNARFPGKTPDS